MNSKILVAAIAIAATAQVACAQFGSGIVFDPDAIRPRNSTDRARKPVIHHNSRRRPGMSSLPITWPSGWPLCRRRCTAPTAISGVSNGSF